MRKLYLFSISATLLPLTGAAEAQSGKAPAAKPGENVTVVGQQPKLVCERFTPTGSIKPEKICRSQADWDQVHVDSLIELQRLEDRAQRYRELNRAREIRNDSLAPN